MTVIDEFLDRPKVVPKQEIPIRHKNRIPPRESFYMPEIQGCAVGNILSADPKNLFPMEGSGDADTDIDNQLVEEREVNSRSSPSIPKMQRILVKTSRTPVRNRRKSRWKLKFHHQALPPEYLRHYKQQERKRRQTETSKGGNHPGGQTRKLIRKSICVSNRETHSDNKCKRLGEETSDVSVIKMEDAGSKRAESSSQGAERLKKDSSPLAPAPEILGEVVRTSSPTSFPAGEPKKPTAEEILLAGLARIPHLNIDVSQNKAFLENLLTNQIEINRVDQIDKRVSSNSVKSSVLQFNRLKHVKQEDRPKSYPIPPSGKIMNYSDLPYMGEITLDGIKPRRGRKPKKADICHLIYKNYGQVFPGAPGKERESDDVRRQPEVSKIQLNSSQGTKGPVESAGRERLNSPLPTISGLINHTEVQNRIINSLLEKRLTQGGAKLRSFGPKERGAGSGAPTDEPLNLCIRDLKSLKIKLSRKHGNVYEAKEKDAEANVSRPEVIDVEEGRSDSEADSTDDNEEEDDLAPFNLVTTELRESSDDDCFLNLGEKVSFPGSRTPPKRAESKASEGPSGSETSPVLLWPGANLFIPSSLSPPSPSLSCYPKLPEIMAPNFSLQPGQERKPKAKSERPQLKRLAPGSNSAKPAHVITKRKRSAIFIPPVPAESTTNPTTEVSICKFKFTGGAKPSLQEKKMLSVDSGGNFRYYSGTGDKSMRGYEYFPRESLQQCQENTGCSPSGVFLTASALGSGEKIPEEIGHSGFFDSDFPLQVTTQRPTSEPKAKPRAKGKKPEAERRLPPDITCYRILRDHLLGSKSDDGLVPEELTRDDGNSSELSGDGFDLRNLPQSYLDAFKMQEESGRMSGRSDEGGGGGCSRNRKLRKTRKSLAREKLEQTFKEKGFLIQTQQLESAEGATYCKFRQLRKFTRYLFRSWKDYLPGNVRNLSVDAGVENPEIVLDVPETGVKMEDADSAGSERFQ